MKKDYEHCGGEVEWALGAADPSIPNRQVPHYVAVLRDEVYCLREDLAELFKKYVALKASGNKKRARK